MAQRISAPEGKNISINVSRGEHLQLGFEPPGASFERTGDDVSVNFGDGGTIVLKNFFAVDEGGELPAFMLPDGSEVAGASFLRSLNPDMDISTAAGPSASNASGGAGEYADGAGELMDGVDRLGSLGTNYWSGGRSAVEITALDLPGDPEGPGLGGAGPEPDYHRFAYQARAVLYGHAQFENDYAYSEHYVLTSAVKADGSAWDGANDAVSSVTYLDSPDGDDAGASLVLAMADDATGEIRYTLDEAAIRAYFAGHPNESYVEVFYRVTLDDGTSYVQQVVIPRDKNFDSEVFDQSSLRGALDDDGLIHGEWHEGRAGESDEYRAVGSNLSDEMFFEGVLKNAHITGGYAEESGGRLLWGADLVHLHGTLAADGAGKESFINMSGVDADDTASRVYIGYERGQTTGPLDPADAPDNGMLAMNGGVASISASGSVGINVRETGTQAGDNSRVFVTGSDITVDSLEKGVVSGHGASSELRATDGDIAITIYNETGGRLVGVGGESGPGGSVNTLNATENIDINVGGDIETMADVNYGVYGGDTTLSAGGSIHIEAQYGLDVVGVGAGANDMVRIQAENGDVFVEANSTYMPGHLTGTEAVAARNHGGEVRIAAEAAEAGVYLFGNYGRETKGLDTVDGATSASAGRHLEVYTTTSYTYNEHDTAATAVRAEARDADASNLLQAGMHVVVEANSNAGDDYTGTAYGLFARSDGSHTASNTIEKLDPAQALYVDIDAQGRGDSDSSAFGIYAGGKATTSITADEIHVHAVGSGHGTGLRAENGASIALAAATADSGALIHVSGLREEEDPSAPWLSDPVRDVAISVASGGVVEITGNTGNDTVELDGALAVDASGTLNIFLDGGNDYLYLNGEIDATAGASITFDGGSGRDILATADLGWLDSNVNYISFEGLHKVFDARDYQDGMDEEFDMNDLLLPGAAVCGGNLEEVGVRVDAQFKGEIFGTDSTQVGDFVHLKAGSESGRVSLGAGNDTLVLELDSSWNTHSGSTFDGGAGDDVLQLNMGEWLAEDTLLDLFTAQGNTITGFEELVVNFANGQDDVINMDALLSKLHGSEMKTVYIRGDDGIDQFDSQSVHLDTGSSYTVGGIDYYKGTHVDGSDTLTFYVQTSLV